MTKFSNSFWASARQYKNGAVLGSWLVSGAPWIWLNAAAVSTSLILVVGLLLLIAVRGNAHFWPANVAEFSYRDETGDSLVIIGEIADTEIIPFEALGMASSSGEDPPIRYLIKTGNKDVTGMDFRSLPASAVESVDYRSDIAVLERREWGNFYGYPVAIKQDDKIVVTGEEVIIEARQRLQQALNLVEQIESLEKDDIGAINYALEQLRLQRKKLELDGAWDDAARTRTAMAEAKYRKEYRHLQQRLQALYRSSTRDALVLKTASGQETDILFSDIVRMFLPNRMSIGDKLKHYGIKVVEFLTEEPREANTEGGVFPAIFGTVLMVMIMSVIVTPLGIIAAVYMSEYARRGFLTRLLRIAVHNLAGVPSIVYGVFGLGFFVYIAGGNIDRLFYPEAAPMPVYGTPGLLWASLTLALLTLPVVIVSTEEGLARIPQSIREGSLALGATRAETLWRIVLPMASPAMMTGLILAVARAAGEVAPLMLVGVVKLAPTLPVDDHFPYLHPDRKFMHLGFHIYDVGFQSPNIEASRPLVYATSFLLVLVIIGLNLTAVALRNRLREKYRAMER